jgi:NADPH-dependent ferric siderophore reductase
MERVGSRDWRQAGGAVLLAGDLPSVPHMVRIAAQLPPDVHATVLIETFAAREIHPVAVRDDIRVTWLVRSDAGPDRYARTPWSRLASAVHAWCAEWSCAPDGIAPECTVWLAPGTPLPIVRMTRALIPARAPRP